MVAGVVVMACFLAVNIGSNPETIHGFDKGAEVASYTVPPHNAMFFGDSAVAVTPLRAMTWQAPSDVAIAMREHCPKSRQEVP